MIKKTDLAMMALSVLGCFLFLGSTIFPFLRETRSGEFWFVSDEVSYWSFKSSTQREALRVPRGSPLQSWFCDYWVRMDAYGTGFLPVFVSMFAAQILTLATAIVFVFVRRRFLTIAATLCSFVVVALMTYVTTSFREVAAVYNYEAGYWGYWLAFPSLCLFLILSILGFVWTKRKNEEKITRPDTPTRTQT